MSGLFRTAVFLVACAVLAAFSQWMTRPASGRCALDGVRIEPVYRVEVHHEQEESRTFCSIRCAVIDLERTRRIPLAIDVHDEMSEATLAAERAFYVRSRVPTVPGTGHDVHVFAAWSDAIAHIETYQGAAVGNPFQQWLRKD